MALGSPSSDTHTAPRISRRKLNLKINMLPFYTTSALCVSCQNLLCEICRIDALPDLKPASLSPEEICTSHGSIQLKEAGIKAATCHLCALISAKFSHDGKEEIGDGFAELRSEWKDGDIRAISIDGHLCVPEIHSFEINLDLIKLEQPLMNQ